MVNLFERIVLNAPFWIKGVTSLISTKDLQEISKLTADAEKHSNAEIAVLIEGGLNILQLLEGMSPSERAMELFVKEKIWDTSSNSGILLYILLSEHAIEIVADRAITEIVNHGEIRNICLASAGEIEELGLKQGIENALRKLSEIQSRLKLNPNQYKDELSDDVRLLK